jgi:flagellar motor protein MotB
MARWLLSTGVIVLLLVLSSPATAETVVAEHITFLQADGRHYLSYKTSRSDASSYNVHFKKQSGKSRDDYLKPYLYIYPNEYRWDTTSNRDANLLRFSQGSYAMMLPGELEKRLTVTKEGTYIFKNWDGSKTPDGHYGIWHTPGNFSQFVYVWVFPQNFEIVKYECNRPGKWVLRHTTLAYFGKNVNDLVFTLTYRPRARRTYEALQATVRGQQEVQLEQLEQGVKVTLAATVLFPSGSSELSEPGKAVLAKIAETLTKRGTGGVAVEGHTDNAPISENLAKIYPTNWELSATRALTVVRYLVDKGVPESHLEARAFGATRPRALNTTEQDKEKNRRIELMVMEQKTP